MTRPGGDSAPPAEADYAVIGGGIIGLAVARELLLQRHDRTVVVLEKEDQIATHQTGRNSGVVHAGIYYPAGSRKAEFCVRGRDQLYAWCSEKRVEARRLGKLIVATEPGPAPRRE